MLVLELQLSLYLCHIIKTKTKILKTVFLSSLKNLKIFEYFLHFLHELDEVMSW